jgi:hypothetical protein
VVPVVARIDAGQEDEIRSLGGGVGIGVGSADRVWRGGPGSASAWCGCRLADREDP